MAACNYNLTDNTNIVNNKNKNNNNNNNCNNSNSNISINISNNNNNNNNNDDINDDDDGDKTNLNKKTRLKHKKCLQTTTTLDKSNNNININYDDEYEYYNDDDGNDDYDDVEDEDNDNNNNNNYEINYDGFINDNNNNNNDDEDDEDDGDDDDEEDDDEDEDDVENDIEYYDYDNDLHNNNNESNLTNETSLLNVCSTDNNNNNDLSVLTSSFKKKISPLEWVGHKVRRKAVRRHHLSSQNNNSNNINSNNSIISTKRTNKIDWTENAKLGGHMFFDLPTMSNHSCYLSDTDALTFHNLNNSIKCIALSKNEKKKRCSLCKIVVHESCVDTLQSNILCKLTFREAPNLKNKETSNDQLKMHHHWVYRKQEDDTMNKNKCFSCSRGFTNRFGLQTSSRSLIICSWCKLALHYRCYVPEIHSNQECTFGDCCDIVVPPSWIIKLPRKNSIHNKPFHRSFKRPQVYHHHHHQQQQQQSQSLQQQLQSQQQEQQEQQEQQQQIQNINHPHHHYYHHQHHHHHHNYLHYHNYHQTQDKCQHQQQYSTRSYIVRPSLTNTNIKPIIVLINPKSGGNLGSKLFKKFMWLLNPRQIFDLTQPGCGPKFALELYRNIRNLRLLVGGGDGTVGWVLSVIDQINFIAEPPAVAVLPLGTGNDLSRALKWGSGYTDEPLTKILSKVVDSKVVKLDRWKIYTETNNDTETESEKTVSTSNQSVSNSTNCDKLKNDIMNNYFSIGADAHVCLEFHERREANPEKFTSRWFNLLQYAEAGSRDQIKKTWKDLTDYLQIECDGKDYTTEIKRKGYHCIIFLNTPTYCSGTTPWGTSNNDVWQVPAIDDGRLEVIGCFTSTLAKIQLGGSGDRICQAKHIKVITTTTIPIQIDGEPSRLGPSIIEIKHKNQALMLERAKLYNLKNIQKYFDIKCLNIKDYKCCKKENKDFRLYAKSLGKLNLLNNESLSAARVNIESNLFKNQETNEFKTPKKWMFLNADEFFRVQDESVDCVMDIASIENEIYIVDETIIEITEAEMSSDDFEINSALSVSSSNELIEASIKGNLKTIKQIDNLKQLDKNGMSALHHASLNGHKEIVKYLLEKVPLEFVNLPDNKKKQTALHLSVFKKRRAIIKMLLKYGADPYLEDKYGNSSIKLVLQSNDKHVKKLFKDFENESSF